MKKTSKITLFLLFIAILFHACINEISESSSISSETTTSDNIAHYPPLTRSGVGAPKVYEKLPNPYSLRVMQKIYNDYSNDDVNLEPTHLYVCFMPQDSAQFRMLYENKDLELFNYPLDIILENGETYVNPEINEGDFPWLYTTVDTDYELPSDIMYEVIDTCYIPDEGEIIASARSTKIIDVETIALGRMGYDIDTSEIPTKAPSPIYPKGTLNVRDESSNVIPLKGVKVRCHNVVKVAYDYTDENGCYTMGKSFKTNVNYSIVFENEKNFSIWGYWGPLAKAYHNMKFHSNTGYSEEISKGSNAWEWAVINNAAYDYYKMCENNSILLPPDDLKMWVFKNLGFSSAPMLRRIDKAIGFNGNYDAINAFINAFGYGILATTLNQLLKSVLPDLIIGTQSNEYNKIYKTVNHELAHASHFCQAGTSFWADYISYIMTYGSYGDGTGRNAELCGIGEMWGYSMGYIQKEEYLSNPLTEGKYPGSVVDGWIRPHVFWDLYAAKVLTKKQIYDCLTPTVDTYDELVAKMVSEYPSKKDSIKFAFVRNGIIPRNVNARLCPPSDSIEIGKEFEISWAYALGKSLRDIEYRFVKEEYFDGTDSKNISIQKCADNKYGAKITINKPGYYIIEAKVTGTNIKKYFHIAKHYKPVFDLPGSEMGDGTEPVTKLGTRTGDPNTFIVTIGSGNILMQRFVALTRVNYRQMTADFDFRRIDVKLAYAGLDTLKIEAGRTAVIELPELYNYQYQETVYDPVDTGLETIPQYITYYTKSFGYYTMKYPEDVCKWIN